MDNSATNQDSVKALVAEPVLHSWIVGSTKSHSTIAAGSAVTFDETQVLHPFKRNLTLHGRTFTVIPSNEMRVVMGHQLVKAVDTVLERDASPIHQYNDNNLTKEMHEALRRIDKHVREHPEVRK